MQLSLQRYLSVGTAWCLVLQIIFWLQIAAIRPAFLYWPFLFAYSQKAMLDLVVFEPPPVMQAILWLIGYLTIGVLLWLLIGRGSPTKPWRRALVGWLGIETALAVVGWALFARGVLRME